MPRSCRRFLTLLALAALGTALAAAPLVAGDVIRTVVLSGTHVPGQAADAIFGTFYSTPSALPLHAINNNGQVAFQAAFSEGGKPFGAMLTEAGGSGLRVVTRSPYLATGSGTPSGQYLAPNISDQGQTVFFTRLLDDFGLDPTIFREDSAGQLSQIAREGEPVPGTDPNLTFSILFGSGNPYSALVAGDQGRVAFLSRLQGTGEFADGAIWKGDEHGDVTPFVRTGDPAPGTSGKFLDVVTNANGKLFMNRLGQVAFHGASDDGSYGIWSEHAEGLKFEVRSGQPAPGFPGATLTLTGGPIAGFNSQGQILFQANITKVGVSNVASLWRSGPDGLSKIASPGDPAPGSPDAHFFNAPRFPVMNARGDVVFAANAQLNDNSNSYAGLWKEDGHHGLTRIASSNEQAPDTEPGVQFSLLSFDATLTLNARGQVAMRAYLQGPGVDNSNNSGLWAQDEHGVLTLIARLGNKLDVSDDPAHPDLRTISALRAGTNPLAFGQFSGNDGGQPIWFNDRGQLTFWAKFTDGTEGIFVSNLVAVPEPQTAALALIPALIAACRHARRRALSPLRSA